MEKRLKNSTPDNFVSFILQLFLSETDLLRTKISSVLTTFFWLHLGEKKSGNAGTCLKQMKFYLLERLLDRLPLGGIARPRHCATLRFYYDSKFSTICQDSVICQFYLDMSGLPPRTLTYYNSRFCF
jgi:hypothetical protein